MDVAVTEQAGERPPGGRLRWKAATAAAAVVAAAVVAEDALATEPTLAGAAAKFLPALLLFGTPLFIAGLVAFVLVAFVVGLCRPRRPGRWVLGPAVLLAAAALADGAYEHRPATRFRKLVIDPMPASVSGLRAAHADSFSDGDAWAFAFHIAPADFAPIARRLNLRETAAAAAGPGEVDRLLVRDAGDIYRRPADARFFAGDHKTVVVTDASGSVVYVYRNFWIDPSER